MHQRIPPMPSQSQKRSPVDRRRQVRRRAPRNQLRSPAEVLGPMLALARRRGVRSLIQALETLLTRWESRE